MEGSNELREGNKVKMTLSSLKNKNYLYSGLF